MHAEFDLDELFELAKQMEAAGEAFYRKAAQLFDEPGQRSLLTGLATAEEAHAARLDELHRNRPASTGSTGGGAADAAGGPSVSYLVMEALVQNRVFGMSADPADLFSGTESLETILHRALEKEKEAVLFYQTLQGVVDEPGMRDAILEILMEEIKHASRVRGELAKLLEAAPSPAS